MNNREFLDYYQILQVHFDASPEVIRGAYKNLSKAYHPDRSRLGDTHMALLNEAYRTLSDPALRKEYHKKWLKHHTGNGAFSKKNANALTFSNDSATMAGEATEAFFHYLLIKDWEAAYTLLSAEDKDSVSLKDFSEWREAIEKCSHLQSFQLHMKKSLSGFCPEKLIYRHAIEFQLSITELDTLTGESKTETVRKYTVYDGASWRVWLGNRNLKPATLRFRMQAEKNDHIDPMKVYHNALSRMDTLTGLLSEEGFFEEAEREANRSKRYKNPITLLVFCVDCEKKERETSCLCQLASIIKGNCRSSDLIGRIGGRYLVCLLAETRRYSGELAARKFLRLISEKQSEEYTVRHALSAYDGFSKLSTAVNELLEML